MFLLFDSREKLHWGGGRTNEEKHKTMSSEIYWRTAVLYVVANIPGNGIPVGNAILNFFLSFESQRNTCFREHFKTFAGIKKK